MSDKALPVENSDYSMPGRADESNAAYYIRPVEAKPKSRVLTVAVVAFVLVSAGVFSYYFANQSAIDSQIMDNTTFKTAEQKMVVKYRVGQFGSDHAHAAVAVFVNGDEINFGLPQFQLQSKYIHFENHNPYQIHKHATGAPLDMLFASIGIEIDQNCIVLGMNNAINDQTFCADEKNSLVFLINGEVASDILSYDINHDDRILISFGNIKRHSAQLEYLESLEIEDVPKKRSFGSDGDITL